MAFLTDTQLQSRIQQCMHSLIYILFPRVPLCTTEALSKQAMSHTPMLVSPIADTQAPIAARLIISCRYLPSCCPYGVHLTRLAPLVY
jgi:hypothetical protein